MQISLHPSAAKWSYRYATPHLSSFSSQIHDVSSFVIFLSLPWGLLSSVWSPPCVLCWIASLGLCVRLIDRISSKFYSCLRREWHDSVTNFTNILKFGRCGRCPKRCHSSPAHITTLSFPFNLSIDFSNLHWLALSILANLVSCIIWSIADIFSWWTCYRESGLFSCLTIVHIGQAAHRVLLTESRRFAGSSLSCYLAVRSTRQRWWWKVSLNWTILLLFPRKIFIGSSACRRSWVLLGVWGRRCRVLSRARLCSFESCPIRS